jgi:hypothetical protein
MDKLAAKNFVATAEASRLERVIYFGGLGRWEKISLNI